MIRVFAVLVCLLVSPWSASAQTPKKVAVILWHLKGQTQSTTVDGVRRATFAGPTSANAWYQENSFGQWVMTGNLRPDGDVFGPYEVVPDDPTKCYFNTWTARASGLASKEGFDATKYAAVIYSVVKPTVCRLPGRAWAGGRTVVIVGTYGTPTLVHELGHVFGLQHASAWRCTNATTRLAVTVSDTCSLREYGDFATMGVTGLRHLSNVQKAFLGWLKPEQIVTVTESGTYPLAPIERPATVAQLLRIQRPNGDYLYLEFRQPFGFDSFATTSPYVTGLLIRVGPDLPYLRTQHAKLLDTTPETTAWTDAALAHGQTFTDGRISVTWEHIENGIMSVIINTGVVIEPVPEVVP